MTFAPNSLSQITRWNIWRCLQDYAGDFRGYLAKGSLLKQIGKVSGEFRGRGGEFRGSRGEIQG
jgi:hypothetical protein